MKIEPLTKINQIKQGDQLLLSDGSNVVFETAKIVKTTGIDGVEVIYNKKKNKYFNVGMYLNGESWVKDAKVVSA